MTDETENPGACAADQGLAALVALLRFHGVGADPEQIRHRFGAKAIGVGEMLRCAKELGVRRGRSRRAGSASPRPRCRRSRG